MRSLRNGGKRPFPRLVVAAVAAMSAGLAATALFTFTTLLRLRTEYLTNRGREVATAVEAQARGPGRRNNAQFWQSLLEENSRLYGGSVAYLALVDRSGAELAHTGRDPAGPVPRIHVVELPLAPGRPYSGMAPPIAGWRLRVGIDEASAGFIRRQAFLHLSVSAAAVAMLILAAYSFLRTTRRFLDLKSRERAEQHLRDLGVMAAALAHEIRNPLGAMKGLTQLAQEELPQNHNAQSAMRTVVSEAERLERLVSDLLDFARPAQPEIREFGVAELISEIVGMIQQKLDEAGVKVELRIPEDLKIRSGSDGLRQVLLNVFSNALEAMPAGGTVVVGAARDEVDSGIVLHVDDSGEGIGDRNPEELFQPFVTTKVRGSGLGLAVSRKIAEALGGSVAIANGAGRGARCSIRLTDLAPDRRAPFRPRSVRQAKP